MATPGLVPALTLRNLLCLTAVFHRHPAAADRPAVRVKDIVVVFARKLLDWAR